MSSECSDSSSFNTFTRHRVRETASAVRPSPLRFVRDGAYVPAYDPVELRRKLAEEEEGTQNRANLVSSTSRVASVYDRTDNFCFVYDDDSLHSTSLSQSPTEYTKGSSSVTNRSPTKSTNETPGTRHIGQDMRDSRDSKNTRSRSTTRSGDSKRTETSTMPISPARRNEDIPSVTYCELDNCMDSLDELLGKSCETEGSPVASLPTSSLPTLLQLPSLDNSIQQSETRSMSNCASRRAIEEHSTGVRRKVRFESESPEGHTTSRFEGSLGPEDYYFTSPRQTIEEMFPSTEGSPNVDNVSVISETTRDDQSTELSLTRSLDMPQDGNDRTQRQGDDKRVRATTDLSSLSNSRSRANGPTQDDQTTVSSRHSQTSSRVGSVRSQQAQDDVLAVFRKKTKPVDISQSFRSENQLMEHEASRSASFESVSQSSDQSIHSTGYNDSEQSAESPPIGMAPLHDLCSEATSIDDVTWRNALFLLSTQPHLANTMDCGWTPLHISCLGKFAPPEFFIRALLVASPEAASTLDHAGRLPLHLLAATSADPNVLQLLVDENPQAILEYDDKGMLPLHLLLKNDLIHLSIQHVRILLGQTIQIGANGQSRKVSRRRRQHLDLTFEEVNELLSRDDRHHKHIQQRYPEDIQVSFRRLARWKRKRSELNGGSGLSAKRVLDDSLSFHDLNPGVLPASPFNQLPLHLAVSRISLSNNTDDAKTNDDRTCYSDGIVEILRVIIAANPSALVARDGDGRTPLLLALCSQDALPNQEMIECLLGRNTVGFESPPIWAGDVELHKKDNNRFTNPAMISTNDTHQLPLHVVADQMTSNLTVLTAVYDAYPGAVHVQDIRGRTPLHLALKNFQRVQLHPCGLSILLTDRVALIKDDEGMIPFDLFVKGADRLPQLEPVSVVGDVATAEVYKRFFQSSVVAPSSFCRDDSLAFLQQLREFPSWLRRYALSASFVQDIVQYETIQAPSVALILLNGIVFGVFLTLFRMEVNRFTTAQQHPIHTSAIYWLSSYILLWQLLFCYASSQASVFLSQCLLNSWFWIDLGGIALSVVTISFMSHNNNRDTAVALGAASTGLLWMSAVVYVARWWHGMALFVGGAARLGRMLFSPLLAVTALVVGFAQMFFTLNWTTPTDGCETVLGGRALCNVRDAYATVYLLLLGTPLVNTGDGDELTNGTIALIAVFTFLLVLLLINLTISVVLETVEQDWNELAVANFWESKLVFHYLTTTSNFSYNSTINNATKSMDNLTSNLWEGCMLSVYGSTENQPVSSSVQLLVRGTLSLLVIPVWFILGWTTLGLLWPPQVRSWLFRVQRNRRSSHCSAFSGVNNLATLRNDLLQLKTMSYDKSNSIEQQLFELRQIILGAVNDDRGR